MEWQRVALATMVGCMLCIQWPVVKLVAQAFHEEKDESGLILDLIIQTTVC